MLEAVQELPVNSAQDVGLTIEEQNLQMRKVTEMRHKAFTELVGIHFQELTRIMMATNGVTELKKRQANKALIEAVKFALDFGIGVTNAEIRQKGEALAKQTNTLAGVLVQALDNRMILLADNMRKEEELKATASEQTTEEINNETTQGE